MAAVSSGSKRCANCGREEEAESPLEACESCKGVVYCNESCQKLDWEEIHSRECGLLRLENRVAKSRDYDLAESLRRHLLISSRVEPFNFVVASLKSFLIRASRRRNCSEDLTGLLLGRFDLLTSEIEDAVGANRVDWLRVSSSMFCICMIHNAMTVRDDDQGWLRAYLHNFGEVLDRVKLFATFQAQGWSRRGLPDESFPFVMMREPPINDFRIPKSTRCVICNEVLDPNATALSSHDIRRFERTGRKPRLVNFIPRRNCPREEFQTWFKTVTRLRTFTKAFVCGESCEHHITFGRLFEAHPLEALKERKQNQSKMSSTVDVH